MRVQDVMTSRVHTVSPGIAAEDAWNRMRMRRIHHLVVTQASAIVGLLSERDLGGAKGTRTTTRPTIHHRAPHRKRHRTAGVW